MVKIPAAALVPAGFPRSGPADSPNFVAKIDTGAGYLPIRPGLT